MREQRLRFHCWLCLVPRSPQGAALFVDQVQKHLAAWLPVLRHGHLLVLNWLRSVDYEIEDGLVGASANFAFYERRCCAHCDKETLTVIAKVISSGSWENKIVFDWARPIFATVSAVNEMVRNSEIVLCCVDYARMRHHLHHRHGAESDDDDGSRAHRDDDGDGVFVACVPFQTISSPLGQQLSTGVSA